MIGPMPWEPVRNEGFTVLLRDLHTMIKYETSSKEVMLWMVQAMKRINGDDPLRQTITLRDPA